MAEPTMAGATPRCRCLPEDVAIWEILVRLPPKSLLRFRAVCRAWRRATSTREFLLAHHGRQPSLQIVLGKPVSGSDCSAARCDEYLAFDHRAAANAQLQPVARLDESYLPQASCDGLLILSKHSGTTGTCYTICNPVTREHSPLSTAWDFNTFTLLGMYQHRPTGEYRLLLHRSSNMESHLLPKGTTGCYVFALGSDQPPRYIGGPDAASGLRYNIPNLVRDSLHWFPVTKHQSESRLVLVFDTTTETFRQMCVPVVSTCSKIFDMDITLGIYSCNEAMQVVDVWELQNYEGEVWKYKYGVKLPVAEIQEQLGRREDSWYVGVFSVDGDVFLLINHGGWIFYVNTDGKIVDSIHRDGQHICAWDLRLKQTLVPHNFLMTPKDYAMNASPFL